MKTFVAYVMSLLLMVAGLVACGASDPADTEGATATPRPTDEPAPTDEPSPTASPTANPTPTAAPPTPTSTPAPEGDLAYTAAYGGNPAGDWDRDNVEQYQMLHPDLEVDRTGVNLYSNPIPTAFYILLESNQQPDVFSSFIGGNLYNYVEQGAIADISDLWQEMGWDEVFPEPIKEMATVDGRQYFVPMAVQWNPIWYRTDIFAEHDLAPPETWEGLLQLCDRLDAEGVIPIALSSTGWRPPLARWFTILNMRLNGPEFHERLMRGQEQYDDERVRQVFEHWATMIEHNCFSDEPTNYRTAADQIYEGEAAMYNLGEWLSESSNEGLPDTFDFFSFPTLNPDVSRGEIALVYGAYMSAEAEHPQEARRFLAYLGSAESQTMNVETLGRVATNLEVDQSLYNDVYRRGLEFVQEADHITQLFEFSAAPEVGGQALVAFSNFWQNPDQIDETLTRLETARAQHHGE
ncbi:MAG: extracellular solute-binding protein [Candidatus Promineifilaceae bacterium]|nr:extracellular solute-binding protein [Candidatus Promineifilaceae bacterium]